MSTNYLLAVSWSWLGHTAVFIGVVLLLLVPGAIQLARWKNFRVLGSSGFAVTFVLSVAFLYLRVGLSTLIDLAIWVMAVSIMVCRTLGVRD